MKVLYLTLGIYDKGGISRYNRFQIQALRDLLVEENVVAVSLLGPEGSARDLETPFTVDHSIQVIRDGRDVMVSLYMNLMKGYTGIQTALNGLESTKSGRIFRENVGLYAKRKKQFKQIFGNDFDPWDVRKNLPAFIEHELQKPFLPAVQEAWPTYVRRWMQGERTVVVKYEDLLEGGPATLGRILSSYTGDFAQGDDVRAAFAQYEFKKMAGRLQGDEYPMSFFRKGISGDWNKNFSPEACAVFQRYAGDLLIELGYEHDDSWITTRV